MKPLTIQLLCSDFRYVMTKRFRRMKFEPNENVLRVTLFVFSICFGILSVSLIALGVVHMGELRWPRPYIGLELLELPTLVIILGSISLVLAFVGCICTKSYNRTLYFIFGLVLCVVLCLELIIAIIAFRNNGEPRRSRTQLLMEEHLKLNGSEYYFSEVEEHVIHIICVFTICFATKM
ncbi:leukocyte surface antigen CD53 isoform X2 [Leptinotarsa decemlineata]|uniref:leukocyte surface antigen CD53 isoform X2 n=1 Tax=Leptinotarsa decemlineata TaxID=7539 RepID=UPI000C254557|nr:leukocyte surface antigen CD53-like isoform X2 [Leptinotarsa decemlineata]